VTGALVLGDLLGRELQPVACRVGVELGGRQLNDAPAGVTQLVEPRFQQRVGDDGDLARARVSGQASAPPSSSATSLVCSSSGS
jgi:hypothetical protein